jgi:hypothetical protein
MSSTTGSARATVKTGGHPARRATGPRKRQVVATTTATDAVERSQAWTRQLPRVSGDSPSAAKGG